MGMRGGDGYAEGGQRKEAVESELVSTLSSLPAPSWPSSQAVSPSLVGKGAIKKQIHSQSLSTLFR